MPTRQFYTQPQRTTLCLIGECAFGQCAKRTITFLNLIMNSFLMGHLNLLQERVVPPPHKAHQVDRQTTTLAKWKHQPAQVYPCKLFCEVIASTLVQASFIVIVCHCSMSTNTCTLQEYTSDYHIQPVCAVEVFLQNSSSVQDIGKQFMNKCISTRSNWSYASLNRPKLREPHLTQTFTHTLMCTY